MVIEDELIIAEDMKLMLERLDYEVVCIAMDYNEAFDFLNHSVPDILLTDIALGLGKDGVDLAKRVREEYRLPIVFVTSYSDRSTLERAKTVKPDGFLVKPFESKDVYAAIEIAISNFRSTPMEPANRIESVNGNSIFVKDGSELIKIEFEGLNWIKCEGNYLELHQCGRRNVVRCSLNDFMEKLPSNKFLRVHKSHAVNITKIASVSGKFIHIGSDQIPLGRNFRGELLLKLNTV